MKHVKVDLEIMRHRSSVELLQYLSGPGTPCHGQFYP